MLNWFSLKLCCGRAYNGGICARKSSGPAQPRMARLMMWTASPQRHHSAKAWSQERHKEGDRP